MRPRLTPQQLLAAAVAASCVSLALGCSAEADDVRTSPTESDQTTNTDDNTSDEADEAMTQEQEQQQPSAPPDERLAPDFTELFISSTGNPFAKSPPGSECDHFRHLHTLQLNSASRELSWDLCTIPSPEAPFELQQGARILGSDELDTITAAYAEMTLSSGPACGSDAAFISMDVTVGGGIERYSDYRECPPTPYIDRAYVSGVFEFWTALLELVPQARRE